MKSSPVQPQADCTIELLLAERPEAARILLRHGMACIGCAMARFETIADVAREYRVDLRLLLNDLRMTSIIVRADESSGIAVAIAPSSHDHETHDAVP
jgi:hybrid cluster-associated redox disulfide protein